MSRNEYGIKLTKHDAFLFAGIVLLFAASLVWTVFYFGDSLNGAYVQVCSGDQPPVLYELKKDRTVLIESEEGENTLCIKDGKAFVSSADCPDQHCVRHKPISKSKESVVCLPNRLVVTVQGGEEWELDDVTN